jgi:ATP synthase protein I
MANETRGDERRQPDGSDDRRLEQRLRRLSERVRARDEAPAARPGATSRDVKGLALGLRLSSEFIAGVVVGAGLGWGFDRLLGTSPWGLIVLTLLGFAAGVYNMMRAMGVLPKRGERPPSGPNG